MAGQRRRPLSVDCLKIRDNPSIRSDLQTPLASPLAAVPVNQFLADDRDVPRPLESGGSAAGRALCVPLETSVFLGLGARVACSHCSVRHPGSGGAGFRAGRSTRRETPPIAALPSNPGLDSHARRSVLRPDARTAPSDRLGSTPTELRPAGRIGFGHRLPFGFLGREIDLDTVARTKQGAPHG